MISTKMMVSTSVFATFQVATFNVMTTASLWGYEIPSAPCSVNIIGLDSRAPKIGYGE